MLNAGIHFLLSESIFINQSQDLHFRHLMHFNAEPDEGEGTQASNIRINSSTEGNSIIDAMRHDWNQQDAGGCLWRAVNEMIDRIVIAHQHGKGIMARDCQ